MTTAAHVLLPREVGDAILSYLCERRREAAAHLPCVVSTATVAKLDRHISALDAALNAPEMFDRLEGGALGVVIPNGNGARIRVWRDDVGDMRIGYRFRDGLIGDRLSLMGADPHAVALALLALAADGEGRG